jgi:gliding motility-associated-like protein
MKKVIAFLFLLFALLQDNSLNAQTDTSFWFAAPEVTFNNNNSHGDRPIYLRFTALNEDATITITQPANSFFSPIVFNVSANTSYSLDLTNYIDALENKPGNMVLNYGLLIRSSKFITAYYEVASVNNPEIFALKGRNALGNNFFIPAQNLMNNGASFNPLPYSSFDIVATEDATNITITPAKDIVGHAAGVSFTIILNKGQTFSATAVNNTAANHLMGSTVTSTKPIAITIKDDSIGGGGYSTCLDLAGDQIVPVELIGTKYITLPGYLNNPSSQPTDQIFVLATEDNTTVSFNSVVVTTLNKGQTFRKGSYNDVFYIETSKPVYVLHLSGFGCEVGTALLPQLDCSGSRTVGFTRSLASPLYVNILVQTGGEGNFTFNGNNSIINAGQFTNVPFTNGAWMYARIQLSTAQMAAGAAAIVKNSTTDFHLSIIHGDAATGCRYGYFSGFNRFDAVSFSNATNSNPGCTGDSLKLYCDVGAAEGITFSWVGPNGFTSSLQNPIIPNVQTIHNGIYTVTAIKANCRTVITSTTVAINQKPVATAIHINPICENKSIFLTASNAGLGSTYQWTGVSGYISNKQIDSIINAVPSMSGNYVLAVTQNGCTAKDTVAVVVNALPSVQISSNSPLCRLEQLQINNTNIVANTLYNWTGPNGFTSSQQNIIRDNFTYTYAGDYFLTATSNGCSKSNSVSIVLKEIPIIQFDPINTICENASSFNINASETSGIAGNSIFTVDNIAIVSSNFNPSNFTNGLHNVRYTFSAVNGCTVFKEQPITISPLPVIDAGNDKVIFKGNSVVLATSIIGNIGTVLWTPNIELNDATITSPIATPTQSRIYKIVVTTTDNCKNIDSVFIKVIGKLNIPNTFSPNGDGFNEQWKIEGIEAFPNCEIQVFDRSGRLVFASRGNTVVWDGKLNGKPLPIATYYYLIRLNDVFVKEPFSGSVTIIR